jgi:hypothetical protein
MPHSHTKTTTDTEATQNGHTPARKPSEQAREVVDVTFAAVPRVAEAVRKTVEQLRDPNTRSQELEAIQNRVNTLRDPATRDEEIKQIRTLLETEFERAKVEGPRIRRKATGQLTDQAKKARKRVEPIEKRVRELV